MDQEAEIPFRHHRVIERLQRQGLITNRKPRDEDYRGEDSEASPHSSGSAGGAFTS